MTGERRRTAEASIAATIAKSARFADAKRIALYRAFDGEVDLTAIEAAARASDKILVHARITSRARPLRFVHAESWQTRTNGLPEPEGPTTALMPGDLLLVPGVAFDDVGVRLGLGGGYYDRTLAQAPTAAVGVCFDCQRTARLPRAPWDMPVAAVVTESGVLNFDIEESQV